MLYPQLPDPDSPRLDAWLELIRAELTQLGRGERVVICHSLLVLARLHLAGNLSHDERVDRVLLVVPPGPEVLWPEIAAFAPPADLSREAVQAAGRMPTRLVCSDNDAYCPSGAREVYGTPLGLDVDLIPGGGHLSIDDGYGHWAAVLAWCLDPATRLDGVGATPMT